MKANKQLLYLFFLVLLVQNINCNENERLKYYKQFKQEVSPEVFLKFPVNDKKDIESSYKTIIDFPATYEYLGYCGFDIVIQYDAKTFKSAIEYLIKNYIDIYNFEDSCKIMIPDTSKLEIQMSKKSYYPVPFIDPRTPEVDSILPHKGVKYYVLNCKKGKFIEDHYYSKSTVNFGKSFNRTFRNGFSDGAIVYFQEKRILYWVLIW